MRHRRESCLSLGVVRPVPDVDVVLRSQSDVLML